MANSLKTERWAFIGLLIFLLLAGIYILKPFFTPLVLGVVFAVLFYRLHKKNLRWTRGRAGLSAFLSVVSVVIFLFIPIAVILTLVTTQVSSLLSVPSTEVTHTSFSQYLDTWRQHIILWIAKFESYFGIKLDLIPWIQRTMTQLASILARYSPRVLAETANFFMQFFIMLIALYYLFRDGDKFYATLVRISPIKDQYEHKLASEIKLTIDGVFYGSFLTGLVQAILATIGFYFAGVPGYIVWGVLTFFMSFIPILGTGAVLIPLVIVLFVQGSVKSALFLLFYGMIVIGSADNLLRPVLTKSNMHPLILFLSFFGGLAVFGPLGILVGPMLMATITATVRIYDQDFAKGKA